MQIEFSDKIKDHLGAGNCQVLEVKFMTVVEYFDFTFHFKRSIKVISVHDHELSDDFRYDHDVSAAGDRLNLDVHVTHGDIEAVWSFGYALLRDFLIQSGPSVRRHVFSAYDYNKGLVAPERDMCVAAGILAVDVATIVNGEDYKNEVEIQDDRKQGVKIADRCNYSWRLLYNEIKVFE